MAAIALLAVPGAASRPERSVSGPALRFDERDVHVSRRRSDRRWTTSTSRSPRARSPSRSGPTGAGKSTFLRAANGLVPHFTGGTFAGRVTVGGPRHDGAPAARARRRRRVRPAGCRRPRSCWIGSRTNSRTGWRTSGVAPAHDAPPRRGDARPARHRASASPKRSDALGRRTPARRDRGRAGGRAADPGARRADQPARPAGGRGRDRGACNGSCTTTA